MSDTQRMMRRVLICVVVFLVVAGVTRALFHGVFDAVGIGYEPTRWFAI